MNLLAIDSSTDCASIALCYKGQYTHASIQGVRQHALVLLPEIDALLKAASARFSELDGFVLGQGPGSFTGLRVASAVVKGLAYAHDLPVYPVSTLASLAYMAEAFGTGPIMAAMDARMGQVYWALYQNNKALSVEAVTAPQEIILAIEEPVTLVGVGLSAYLSQFKIEIKAVHELALSAEVMIKMVQDGLIMAQTAKDIEPIYVRNQVTQGGVSG